MAVKRRIVILISGTGSNMAALIKACSAEDYPAEVVGVISNKSEAKGLETAKQANIATYLISPKDYGDKASYEDALLALLLSLSPDYICLAGFMRLLSQKIIAPFENRILNIHPSLLPLFPGLNTHERALEAGVKVSGCTVHIVTAEMDKGPILAQACVPVFEDDSADDLASRILAVEHQLYPRTLRALIEKQSHITPKDSHLICL